MEKRMVIRTIDTQQMTDLAITVGGDATSNYGIINTE